MTTNKIIPFLLMVFLTGAVFGQAKRKVPPGFKKKAREQQNSFLDKQWWIGLTLGPNLTKAVPDGRYSVLVPTDYDIAQADKAYDGFSQLGSQATLEITFNYKGFGFSFQPTYRLSRFSYGSEFLWENTENAQETLQLNYKSKQSVDYADLPLIVKYEFTSNRLKPFIQAGIFYSVLVNASKTVERSGIDNGSGGNNPFTDPAVTVGAKDLFHKGYWGIISGAGVNYSLGNVRLVLDASYRIGMSNITNTENRFSNDRLAGIGDVFDDMKIDNIVISAGVLFPMRFLSTSFKSSDR
ncbi:MAG: outer membrane beta-barrel protein [Cyclobacteriaceae bacterium]